MKPSKELLERCRKDDRKAHYDLYRECFQSLYAICRRYYINKDDCMAALNMVFYKMVKNISTYIPKAKDVPFELWARRIAINYIIDEFRKNSNYKRLIETTEVSYYENNLTVEEEIEHTIDKEKIIEAVDQLPEMNKAVFNLYVIDGYKHEEIGKLLGISSSTSKVHLHRAKKALRTLIDEIRKNDRISNKILS
ncbi:MAG: RNA polymerase sigma factor [Bacteroidetes bacterium]|nr:RNA polymerase sigma factor [Bacteroidota bacterium]MBK9415337.1 RNA polymerase sigma factor [Bacteroidota bacterium]MBL0032724.1 RNA polymerase sigma factor [Bacteroidota bacterium]MBP6428733.1 RNA polymerase sigma factor [Bacteroidia bacterium]MBP6657674.1 RNA polymerase sigma factor [Bacteroidia bacterium]